MELAAAAAAADTAGVRRARSSEPMVVGMIAAGRTSPLSKIRTAAVAPLVEEADEVHEVKASPNGAIVRPVPTALSDKQKAPCAAAAAAASSSLPTRGTASSVVENVKVYASDETRPCSFACLLLPPSLNSVPVPTASLPHPCRSALAAELETHRNAIVQHYAAAMDVVKQLQELGQTHVQLSKARLHAVPVDDGSTAELQELNTKLQHEKCVLRADALFVAMRPPATPSHPQNRVPCFASTAHSLSCRWSAPAALASGLRRELGSASLGGSGCPPTTETTPSRREAAMETASSRRGAAMETALNRRGAAMETALNRRGAAMGTTSSRHGAATAAAAATVATTMCLRALTAAFAPVTSRTRQAQKHRPVRMAHTGWIDRERAWDVKSFPPQSPVHPTIVRSIFQLVRPNPPLAVEPGDVVAPVR